MKEKHDGNAVAGYSIRIANADEGPERQHRRDDRVGFMNWSQHSNLQRR